MHAGLGGAGCTAAAIGGLTLLAAAFRWMVGVQAGGDLWLDEAWTVLTARDAAARGLHVLAEPYRVDNNHPLITWLVVVLGPERPGWVFRTAVWAATAALPAVGYAAFLGLGRRAAWAAAVFLATAFALTVYGTEVRGYGLALTLSVAGLALLTRADALAEGPQAGRGWALAVFWLVCGLGIMSHLTFVHAMAALAAWTTLTTWRHTRSVRQTVGQLLRWHGVPVAVLLLAYAGFFRHVKVAGGPAGDVGLAVIGALSMAWNGPWAGAAATITGIVALTVMAAVCWRHRREPLAWVGPTAGGAAILTFGLKAAVFGQSDVVFPRYFLVASVLWAVATAALGAAAVRTAIAAFVAGGLAVLVLAASAVQHTRFALEGGRGQYRAALAAVAASDVPTLASDYDARTLRLENYYRRGLPGRILYVRSDLPRPAGGSPAAGGSSNAAAGVSDSTTPAAWFLLNSSTTVVGPPPRQLDVAGRRYVLVRTYGQYGPSGWPWHLYRRADDEPPETVPQPGGSGRGG